MALLIACKKMTGRYENGTFFSVCSYTTYLPYLYNLITFLLLYTAKIFSTNDEININVILKERALDIQDSTHEDII